MAKSGRDIHRDLERTLQRAREELDRAGVDVQRATAEREELRAGLARELARLAQVRLAELDANRVAGGLDEADRHALGLLQRRRAAAEHLRDEIADADRALQALDAERDAAAAARDAALREHDDRTAAALERAAATEAHAFQRTRAERAAEQAARAEAKARQAEADRDHKRKAYDADKLFRYLWQRRYRFPEYRAGNLTRALDGWVARLCRYEQAHRDYAMLLEIPERLRAHAEAQQHAATAEAEALAAIESAALEADGVPTLAAALQERELALGDVERRLDAESKRREALLARRASLDAGEDADTKGALAALAAQLEREDVATLQADAQRTGTAEDDAIVTRIGDLRRHAGDVERQLGELRQQQQAALASLQNLEELRRRFRQSGYDSADSEFDGGFDPGRLFGGLLMGGLVLADVWGTLGRHQRFRRRHVTGADVAGSVIGGVLGGVLSGRRGGFGGGGFGGRGGFGGGGFRTGGGFGGGGGFRTGGGF